MSLKAYQNTAQLFIILTDRTLQLYKVIKLSQHNHFILCHILHRVNSRNTAITLQSHMSSTRSVHLHVFDWLMKLMRGLNFFTQSLSGFECGLSLQGRTVSGIEVLPMVLNFSPIENSSNGSKRHKSHNCKYLYTNISCSLGTKLQTGRLRMGTA